MSGEIERSVRSLALTAVDGLLAFENIENGRRGFGKLVNDNNIRLVLNNIVRITEELQKKGHEGLYRNWLWMLYHTYHKSVPIIQTVRHLPLLNFNSSRIPTILLSENIRKEVLAKVTNTPWTNHFSFQENLDGQWLGGNIHKVLIRTDIRTDTWEIAPCLQTALEKIKAGILEDFLYDAHHNHKFTFPAVDDNSIEAQDVRSGMHWKNECAMILELYMKHPDVLALCYVAMFFSSKLRKILIKLTPTMCKFDEVFKVQMFESHTYQMLKLGMPALHKAFEIPYTSANPFTGEGVDLGIQAQDTANGNTGKSGRLAGLKRYSAVN